MTDVKRFNDLSLRARALVEGNNAGITPEKWLEECQKFLDSAEYSEAHEDLLLKRRQQIMELYKIPA